MTAPYSHLPGLCVLTDANKALALKTAAPKQPYYSMFSDRIPEKTGGIKLKCFCLVLTTFEGENYQIKVCVHL